MLFRGSWETEFIREVAEQRDRMGYRRELWDVADARIQPGSRRRESGAGVSFGLGPLFFREVIDHVGEPMIPAATPATAWSAAYKGQWE